VTGGASIAAFSASTASDSEVDITGITFEGNSAGIERYSIDCMDVYASQVKINGSFCAYNNTAKVEQPDGRAGACIVVSDSDSLLQFNDPGSANMANNIPTSVALIPRNNRITCSVLTGRGANGGNPTAYYTRGVYNSYLI
jgi:hypothetical protein